MIGFIRFLCQYTNELNFLDNKPGVSILVLLTRHLHVIASVESVEVLNTTL